MANLEVHQKQFRSHCGNHDKRNLITLCFDCHGLIHGKSTRSGSVLTVRCWPGLGKYLKGYHTRSTHLVRCTRTAPSYSSRNSRYRTKMSPAADTPAMRYHAKRNTC